ncbi:MAG: DoxX family protein [Brumimicrobium sp.]
MSKLNNKNLSGKSMLFNIISILVNLTGLTMLVMGYHEAFEDSALLFQILGYVLFIIGLGGLIVFQGWLLFAYIARVLVGGLFIVSGLIKANDPKGFAYKLEEYFEDGALAYRIKDWFGWETFSLEFLISSALSLSIIICVLEILLGVLTILGTKIRLATWLMLGMMVFFTFLTWHTSECDPHTTFKDVDTYALESSEGQSKIANAENDGDITILEKTSSTVTVQEVKKPQCVDDCGCFGDAMKGSIGRSLTPAESFWKDLVLLYFVILIFISRRTIKPNNVKENTIMIFFGLVFVGFFSYIFSWTFPLFFALITILLSLWLKRTGGKVFGNDFGLILMTLILCSLFVTYVLMYRPMKDYRPYAVGSDLIEKMNDGEDGVYENIIIYKNKKTGKDTTLTKLNEETKSIWSDTETWEFKDRETVVVDAGKLPSIQQFDPKIDVENITPTEENFPFIKKQLDANKSEYVDVVDKESGNRYPQLLEDFYIDDWDTSRYVIGDTLLRLDESFDEISLKDYILEQEQIILIVSRDIEKGNFSRIQRLKEVSENAATNNIDMIMISTANKDDVKAFREKYELSIPTVMNDETEIKAITRSNPTMIILKKGVVKGKYAFRSTPSWEWLTTNILDIENNGEK